MTSPAQPAPPHAQAVFGAHFAAAQRYAAMLSSAAVERGLIGPREPERIWTRHLLNAAALSDWVPSAASVLDVGSGAGLPGIPLLLARPDLAMTLVEPMARRVAFCEEVRHALGLTCAILRARAEQVPPGQADVVVVRAVAPLERLVGMTLPLLRPGGQLLALKGERAESELAQARPALEHAGAAAVELSWIGAGEDRTCVVAVSAGSQALR